VNGLESNVETETDKTQSDDDDSDDAGKPSIRRCDRPSLRQRSKPSVTAAEKATVIDDDSEDDDDDDDVVPIKEPRVAKVVAGEVIKQWQTKTRSKGFY